MTSAPGHVTKVGVHDGDKFITVYNVKPGFEEVARIIKVDLNEVST